MLSCALNLLLPVCIDKIGYNLTCVVRALQGLSEVSYHGNEVKRSYITMALRCARVAFLNCIEVLIETKNKRFQYVHKSFEQN